MSETFVPMTRRSWVYKLIMLGLVNPLYFLVYRVRIEGREHLPDGPALIAGNHTSFLDIPLVARAAAPRHVAFIARDTLADARWFGWVMRKCGALLIQRGKPDRATLRRITTVLEAGGLVGMFPEGKRPLDGKLTEFKKGAFLSARVAKVPIVPAVLRGCYEAWPRGTNIPRGGRLSIRFLPPVDGTAADALEQTRAAIARELGEPEVFVPKERDPGAPSAT